MHEAGKDAASKSMMYHKTSSGCAADEYHGTHVGVAVDAKARGEEVTLVDTMSPALLRVLVSRTKSADVVSAEPEWKNMVDAFGEKARAAAREQRSRLLEHMRFDFSKVPARAQKLV